ncbi:MAG: DUF4143 domain-containing protein [Corynebacterium sp.]|nr:DUF4143 domain-containing protein [Corynebacterium sp.]
MAYLPRALDKALDVLMNGVPAIAIDGPKGVGKTETCLQRADYSLRLDMDEDVEVFRADPSFATHSSGTLLIDEWQKEPVSWDYVRRAVDSGAESGRFLLTGSATPKAGTDTHSGAGRIISLRMRPMALFERLGVEASVSLQALFKGEAEIVGKSEWGIEDYVKAIEQSGLPGVLSLPDIERKIALDGYLNRIIDRDLPDQGYFVRDRQGLQLWMRSYAALSSTDASYTEILDRATPGESKKPNKITTGTYRSKLTEIWMLDPVRAWQSVFNPIPRVKVADKHQLADPAFAVRLLEIPSLGLLRKPYSKLLGPLFESLATLSVRVAVEAQFGQVGHLRTRNGDHEIDLIATSLDGAHIAFEVKAARAIRDEDVKHLLWLKEQLGDEIVDLVVLYSGSIAYRRQDGVAVIPLSLFGF